MTVINLRPVGWNGLAPRQWGALRELIQLVLASAFRSGDLSLAKRAQHFLTMTENQGV